MPYPTFDTTAQPNSLNSNYYPQLNNNNSGSLPYSSNNDPSLNVTAQPTPIIQSISARTASYGPFPVEMDCPYCQVIYYYFFL